MNPIYKTIATLGTVTALRHPFAQTQLSPALTNQTSAEDFYNQGIHKGQQKDYQGAFEDYTQAIQRNPNFTQAYLHRSVVHILLGNFTSAVEDYTAAVQISSFNFSQTRTEFGKARADVGDTQGAISEYSDVLQYDANYAEAYQMRGNIRADLGDKQAAIEDWQKAAGLFQRLGKEQLCQEVLNQIRELQQ